AVSIGLIVGFARHTAANRRSPRTCDLKFGVWDVFWISSLGFGIVRRVSVPIKVCIVEDDDWIRENLATLIGQTEGFRCHGTYRSAEEALARIAGQPPDVVLMDINLPNMSGIECVRVLKNLVPSAQILMLTVYEDSDKIFNSLLAG